MSESQRERETTTLGKYQLFSLGISVELSTEFHFPHWLKLKAITSSSHRMRKKAHIETARKKGSRERGRDRQRGIHIEREGDTRYRKEIMQMDGKVECVALIQFEIEIENVFDDCAIKCLGFTQMFTCIMEMGNWA